VPAKMKSGPLKIIVPKVKTGMKGPSAVELAVAKPVKRNAEICLGFANGSGLRPG
jgi:hypothetical protein